MEYDRKMDHPSNGLSIVGYLRPAFADEESYLRRQFHSENSDGDNSDWQGTIFFALVIESPEWTSLALNKVAVTKGGYRIRWILHNECN